MPPCTCQVAYEYAPYPCAVHGAAKMEVFGGKHGPNMRPEPIEDDDYKVIDYQEQYEVDWDLKNDDEDMLKAGKSMLADIDDRINNEFMSPSVGITAQSNDRKRFRVIPEE